MRFLVRLTRPALVAILGIAVLAAPGGSSAEAAAGLLCRTSVVGVTGTDRLIVHDVVNSKIVGVTKARTPLPYDPSAMAFKSSSVVNGVPQVGILAIHPSGVPRVIAAKLWQSPTTETHSIVWSSRTWYHYHFLPRLITGYGGDQYYYVTGDGHLARYGDIGRRYGVGAGYDDLTTLGWGGRYVQSGRSVDVLYATTAAGALEEIKVPLEAPWTAERATLRASGYASVSELSVGRCNNSDSYGALITITPGSGATWTTVRDATGAAPVATFRGLVQGHYAFAVHSVF